MTIVEFFDNNSIENMISTLLCAPEKMILVGDKRNDKTEKTRARYQEIAEKHNLKTEISYKSINRNNLMNIVSVLSNVIEENGVVTFDLTGGEDLYLVAVGILYNKYPDKVQLHRFNIRNSSFIDCDADGNQLSAKEMKISIEENIEIYGGKIVYTEEKKIGTYRWDYNEDFCNDIIKMWEICKKDVGIWNVQMTTLGGLEDRFVQASDLSMQIDRETANRVLKKKDFEPVFFYDIFSALYKNKLILDLNFSNDTISFRYKNAQVKRVLTKAGQLLELFVAVNAMRQKDDSKNPVYDEVMTGVMIDWDGVVHKKEGDVENEIDVVLMRGMIPVFVSCKNGDFKVEELYKLSTVARRFGGKYAKLVLVATDMTKLGDREQPIRERAKEMGIRIIDNVGASGFGKTLKSLWNN